mmetsp:Transcript_139166/g.361633  ORF Transcript_139166/g.361633 Transcript_139166/m.361633 type:complete len:85 (-) Transcript_139166:48-302(-)
MPGPLVKPCQAISPTDLLERIMARLIPDVTFYGRPAVELATSLYKGRLSHDGCTLPNLWAPRCWHTTTKKARSPIVTNEECLKW